MEAGNLFCRCARCANRCRVRLTIDGDSVVTEARKQVPGRRTTYEKCPNLEKNVGQAIANLKAAQLVKC